MAPGHRLRALRLMGMLALGLALASPGFASPYGLRDKIVAYLEARAPRAPDAVVVPPLADFRLPGVPADRVQVALASHPQARRVGKVPVTVTLSVDGRVLRRGVVNAEVRMSEPVVVALRTVRRGETLSSEHLGIEQRDLSDLPEGFVRDPRDLIGRRATRSIAPGKVLQKGWVETPPVVHRGEVVRMRLEHGPLLIEGRGVARRDGRPGEWIRVLNPESKRELMGRVEGDGVVHVLF